MTGTTAARNLGSRPAAATGLCVTPANSSHQVINPSNFHCIEVAPDGDWQPPLPILEIAEEFEAAQG